MTSATDAVFVTGAHRSGTTVLGEILSQSPGSWTVWEPFNQHWGLSGVDGPYPYITAADPSPAIDQLGKYLDSGRGEWKAKRHSASRLPHALRVRQRSVQRRRAWVKGRGEVPIVKDPFVLLALGAIQPRLTSRPIVVAVRHPCSWLLSLRRMGWPAGPELNAILKQRELYETHLADLLPERDWTSADDVEAGAIAWACLYRMVAVQARESSLLVVPLEAFADNPEGVMRVMFAATGLTAPCDLNAVANHYARSAGNVVPEGRNKHALQRDSQALKTAWRDRLSQRDMDQARGITASIFDLFYTDWEAATASISVMGPRPKSTL